MIVLSGLCKSYGAVRVVDGVSFECRPGTVTGFLGPNGAGKSTTLRMLTGLARPDAGSATIAGRRYRDLPYPTRTVGTLLDASAMHDGRTGRHVLDSGARLAGVDRRRVDELLGLVGLAGPAADRRVGTYSLGMRQRLGIALALVGDPGVLVLDEPANGLDPAGIALMRGLLREFADGGGTVLLSSHLLGEVQATVDRLVVIGRGRIVASGSLDELLTSTGTVVTAYADDAPALVRALSEHGLAAHERGDGSLLVEAPPEAVARAARAGDALVVELRPSERTGLEDLFLQLTGDAAPDDPPAPDRTPDLQEAAR